MIQDRLIVCIASSWDYDPTSKHQMIKILSERNDILWVNYHGSRRPSINRADISGAVSALWRVARGVRKETPTMAQVTPLVIPGAAHPMLQTAHQALLVAQIRRAIRKTQRGRNLPVQVWSFAPDVPYLVGQFNEECFLYYCVDEYRSFQGFDTDRIAVAEDEQVDRADVVVATSELLRQARRKRRPDTLLACHGVDYDHFATAWRNCLPVPNDLAALPRPVFGYFGLIEHWVDLKLLSEVARKRPRYSFVLLGEVKVDVTALRSIRNVHFLGRKPYTVLPVYAAHFDAGLLLFAQNQMTRHVNPVKMREYLAAGLPVISTPLPEAKRYRQWITTAPNPEAFVLACDRVLRNHYASRSQDISRTVIHETWRARVEALSTVVMRQVNPDPIEVSKPVAEVLPGRRAKPALTLPT